jgi:hypothetical protein
MLLRVLAALLLLSAAARAALNCDDLREAPAAAEDAITQQDMCSLCQEIVRNRYRWDWQTHEEALLAGLPSKFENTWVGGAHALYGVFGPANAFAFPCASTPLAPPFYSDVRVAACRAATLRAS